MKSGSMTVSNRVRAASARLFAGIAAEAPDVLGAVEQIFAGAAETPDLAVG